MSGNLFHRNCPEYGLCPVSDELTLHVGTRQCVRKNVPLVTYMYQWVIGTSTMILLVTY